MDFKGKTVLVTGGGAGIGQDLVMRFAELGARLVVLERDAERVEALGRALATTEARHLLLHTDVTSAEQLDQAFTSIGEQCASLDVLVNNVGDSLQIFKPLEDCSDDDFDRLYAVNLGQVLQVTRRAIPLLRRHGFEQASIVNIASIEGFRGIPYLSAYAAFKAALGGFTKSLALELAAARIRVNQIAPETTDTAQVPVSNFIHPEYRERVGDWIPLGRFGEVRDMSNAVLFLASDQASWITGTTLHVDGGALAAGGWYRTPQGGWTLAPVIERSGFIY
ncbi:SDR family NAD(P)-dependent oxidoreductase [Pseudomonas sp. H9]|uniref:SDR family NAD(P)-dependent oxidoreductase n=1 Tax=Pseudomonas sp. H9 TaxID=483968 RepID=UPI0010580216|nr:SDR family NAD(P)-dependent oxidoreductase [Pseudomonas sp. H9]TDF85936.1 SDR family oxidoreductase [Pseudomonas sp. H9]